MKFYICPICGNIVRKVVDQAGTLVCCNQPMKELEAGKTEGALEKHIPVYEVKENEIHVQVGEVLHPMEEKHWITDLFFVTETMEYH